MTISKTTYFKTFGALMVFTVLTVLASMVHLGRLNAVVALAIAVTKATLVALYFMHLRTSNRLVLLAAGAGFYWLGILLVLSLGDYLSRSWLPVPGK